MRSQSIRRHHLDRLKQKAVSISKSWGIAQPEGKVVGKIVSTHGSACSCWMCGNPRRFFGRKTLQELRNVQPGE